MSNYQADKLTPDLIKILQEQTPDTLADWWCELNSWSLPPLLKEGVIVAEGNESGADFSEDGTSVRWQIMQLIESRVLYFKIMRRWYQEMPDEEFESFWLTKRGFK